MEQHGTSGEEHVDGGNPWMGKFPDKPIDDQLDILFPKLPPGSYLFHKPLSVRAQLFLSFRKWLWTTFRVLLKKPRWLLKEYRIRKLEMDKIHGLKADYFIFDDPLLHAIDCDDPSPEERLQRLMTEIEKRNDPQ